MKIHPRLGDIQPSVTLALNAKAKAMKAAGEDVISLAAGEPDFAPPECVMAAARAALEEGRNKYTPAAGLPELREAVAERMRGFGHGNCTAANIVLSAGGKQALHNIFQATLFEGDEVILPAPAWVSYPSLIELAGATPVVIPPATGGFIDVGAVAAAVTAKTRMVILNSPCNPSGAVISKEELDALEQVVADNDLLLLSDELYADLVYGGAEHHSPGARPALDGRTLTVGGFSKSYAMTGWRLGWSVTPLDVAGAITAYQSHTTSNPNSLAQYAVLSAFKEAGPDIAKMRDAFDRRRQLMVAGLSAIDGITCPEPKGAFYAFPDVTGAMAKMGHADDVAFCNWVLDELKVAIVPGTAFFAPGRCRLSYAAADEVLEDAIGRLAKALA